jgi:DNA end-binding protein Ku
VRPWDELKLPAEGSKAATAETGRVEDGRAVDRRHDRGLAAERYEDRFTQAVMALVDKRAAAGQTEQVQPLEDGTPSPHPATWST